MEDSWFKINIVFDKRLTTIKDKYNSISSQSRNDKKLANC